MESASQLTARGGFPEGSLRRLDDSVRAPGTAEQPELVERKALRAACSRTASALGLVCQAQASLSRLTSVRDSPLKLQAGGEVGLPQVSSNCTSAEVQVLREVKLQYWPSPSGVSTLRSEDVTTDAEATPSYGRLQYVRVFEMPQVDAWRDDMPQPAPVVQDRAGRESSVGSLVTSGQRRS